MGAVEAMAVREAVVGVGVEEALRLAKMAEVDGVSAGVIGAGVGEDAGASDCVCVC